MKLSEAQQMILDEIKEQPGIQFGNDRSRAVAHQLHELKLIQLRTGRWYATVKGQYWHESQ